MDPLRSLISRYFFVFDEPFRKWMLLLIAFIMTALLDVFGIGALGIFIQAVVAPEGLAGLEFIPDFVKFPAIDDKHGTLVIGLSCFAFFALRTVVAYLLQMYTFYFNARKQIHIQRRVFYSYLHAPLLFRKDRNFAKMLYNVTFLVEKFILDFSNSLFAFAVNAVLFFVLAVFLSATNLIASIVICLIFFIASGLYYILIKNRSTRYGQKWAMANEMVLKNFREGIGALDEIQILGFQDHFQERVRDNLKMSLHYRVRAIALHLIPRPMAEFLLLGFIIFFTVGYHFYFGSITQISALIGIFGMAGLRLVPAASHISASLNGMKNSSFSVNQLYEEMQALKNEGMLVREGQKLEDDSRSIPAFDHVIDIDRVTYQYPDTVVPVLKDFSAQIRKGQRVAIVGKSGSGKTTLMNILLGNMKPVSGSVLVDGIPIHHSLRNWRSMIFYLPQNIYLFDDTIRANIALGTKDEEIDEGRLRRAIEQAQLYSLVESLPNGAQTVVGDQGTRLSGGQRQRIGIARALYYEREIIIMDEATSALDDETEAEVKESIRNLPDTVTVIMITHNLKEDDIFDQIIRLA